MMLAMAVGRPPLQTIMTKGYKRENQEMRFFIFLLRTREMTSDTRKVCLVRGCLIEITNLNLNAGRREAINVDLRKLLKDQDTSMRGQSTQEETWIGTTPSKLLLVKVSTEKSQEEVLMLGMMALLSQKVTTKLLIRGIPRILSDTIYLWKLSMKFLEK